MCCFSLFYISILNKQQKSFFVVVDVLIFKLALLSVTCTFTQFWPFLLYHCALWIAATLSSREEYINYITPFFYKFSGETVTNRSTRSVAAYLKMSLTFDFLTAGILGHRGWHAQGGFHTQGQRKGTNNSQEYHRWWTCTGEELLLIDYDISLDILQSSVVSLLEFLHLLTEL